jgi:hypothetical protein
MWTCRYLARKAAAPEHYQQRLLTRVLAAWRDRTAAKQRAEQQRRLATRHHYLSTIHKVLQAWREAMAVACHKQQLAAAAEQHHNKRLLTAVLQVCAGFLLLLHTHNVPSTTCTQHARRPARKDASPTAPARVYMTTCLRS